MNQKFHNMGDQETMTMKTESLKKFHGNRSDFHSWSKHMADHMGKVHGEWRRVLKWIPKYMPDRSFQIATLRMETLGPYNENAVELAVKSEQTWVDWLPERLYNNRAPLAGGDEESGNGFEMWRRLHLNNVGDGEVLEEAGVECLRTYGQCHKMSEVSDHMDGWQLLFDKYGSELAGATRHVRNMFLNILPK